MPVAERENLGDALGQAWTAHRARRASVKKAQAEQRMTFRRWANRVPEKRGPLDFERFPFQAEWYSEPCSRERELVLVKAAQIGASAWSVRWLVYWVDMLSAIGLYVFPRWAQMKTFSQGRVRTLIHNSEYLRGRVSEDSIDNVEQREIGGGMAYFRGSESEFGLESVDADILGLDEYDRLSNVALAEYRIANSDIGLIRRLGIPSIPNFGISKLIKDTDTRRWLVKCKAGHELPLRWPGSIDLDRAIRVCAECHAELRDQDVAAGRWVAEHPDNDVRGYHAPRLIVPRLDIATLIKRSKKTLPEDRQAFWNRDMGEPYAPEEGRLSEQAIATAASFGEKAGATSRAGGYVGFNVVTMGVDVHSDQRLYVRISEQLEDGRRRALFLGTVANFDELAKLVDAYNVRVGVLDHLPEKRLSRSLAERFPGRILLCAYVEQEHVLAIDEATRMVKVRRTDMLDATVDHVRHVQNLLPPDQPPEYAEQLGNEVREVSRDTQGRKVVRWVQVGASHYLHAEVYDLVAKGVWEHREIERDMRVGEVDAMADKLEYERSALHEDKEVYREGPLPDEY